MTVEIWTAFVVAAIIVTLLPGPSMLNRFAIVFMFALCASAPPAGAQDVAFLCQVRGLEPGGDDFLAVRTCADTSCEKTGELYEGDTVACGQAVEGSVPWREIYVGGAWRYAANRYMRTLAEDPHANLPSLSRSAAPLHYLDMCYQCMSEAQKAVYLKDILAELVFQTGGVVTGEGDNETGNICVGYPTRAEWERGFALAQKLIAAKGLKLEVRTDDDGCPVG